MSALEQDPGEETARVGRVELSQSASRLGILGEGDNERWRTEAGYEVEEGFCPGDQEKACCQRQ